MLGATLDGKYRIERLVGAGTMGSVYEAEHTGTGRRVAIKVITSVDVARDPRLVSRFQREAKAAGAIDTQHITQVLDTGVDEAGVPFLVMELLTGEDLQHVFERLAPLSPALALRLVAQACLGLQKAHEAQVVHRDIKPANLFLARRDAGEMIVKVLDFGLAKVKTEQGVDGGGVSLTKTGSMLGSPLYMSPEQARGLKSIDHRADLWSLGVVLYRALTGRTPYDDCDALGGLIISICNEDAAPVQQYAPWVQPEVAAVVHKALQRDAGKRFESATAMLEAIRPLLPGGWTITEAMLVPMSDAEKAEVAPQPSPVLPAPPAPVVSASAPPAAPAVIAARAPVGAGGPPIPVLPAAPVEPAAPVKTSRAPLLGGVALVAVLAAGLYLSRSPGPPAAAAQPKRVQLVVLPADASVELDGVKAALQDGVLDIRGAPGSVHRVRVSSGKSEVVAEVTVTESGARPPKVELAAGGKP